MGKITEITEMIENDLRELEGLPRENNNDVLLENMRRSLEGIVGNDVKVVAAGKDGEKDVFNIEYRIEMLEVKGYI